MAKLDQALKLEQLLQGTALTELFAFGESCF